MKYKKLALILFCLLISILTAFSQELDPRLHKANVSYNEGNYQQAVELYEQVVQEENIAPELFYNLGNAYYKNNQIAKAILYYERALKLKPNDEDIQFNIEIANLKIVDKMDTIPQLFFHDWWDSVRNLFSMDAWAWLAILTLLLALSFFTWYFLTLEVAYKKLSFFLGILCLLVSILGFIFAQKQYNSLYNAGEAVVMLPSVVVKSSPAESGTELFVIHEGLKVTAIENVGNWYQIKLPNGNQGWLKEGAIEII